MFHPWCKNWGYKENKSLLEIKNMKSEMKMATKAVEDEGGKNFPQIRVQTKVER